jgi:XTP/dITP diphosphohydrolase
VRLVLASRNAHKARELSALIGGVELEPLPSAVRLPPETGTTYAENALGKARFAAAALGRPAVADDSGIEAAARGGRPGVRSARFAGAGATDAENLARLVSEAPPGTALRYVCALAYVDAERGIEHVVHGTCDGAVAERPRGEGGFGYDPIFVPDDLGDGRTMAELSPEEKDAISHRGRAARALATWLKAG